MGGDSPTLPGEKGWRRGIVRDREAQEWPRTGRNVRPTPSDWCPGEEAEGAPRAPKRGTVKAKCANVESGLPSWTARRQRVGGKAAADRRRRGPALVPTGRRGGRPLPGSCGTTRPTGSRCRSSAPRTWSSGAARPGRPRRRPGDPRAPASPLDLAPGARAPPPPGPAAPRCAAEEARPAAAAPEPRARDFLLCARPGGRASDTWPASRRPAGARPTNPARCWGRSPAVCGFPEQLFQAASGPLGLDAQRWPDCLGADHLHLSGRQWGHRQMPSQPFYRALSQYLLK